MKRVIISVLLIVSILVIGATVSHRASQIQPGRFQDGYYRFGDETLTINSTNQRVGVNTQKPDSLLEVNGSLKVTENASINTLTDLDGSNFFDSGCGDNQHITSINPDGTISCGSDSGDIAGVTASTGLSGGGTSGTPSLSVATSYQGAQARCPDNEFLDGDGQCLTASEIVSAGGGGGGFTSCSTETSAGSIITCSSGTMVGGGVYCNDGVAMQASYPSGNGWQGDCDGTGHIYVRCCS